MQEGVKKLESNLDAGPQLLSLPKDMAVLQQSVANFGSQLADIDSRVKSLREDYDSLENSDNDLTHRITSLEVSLLFIMGILHAVFPATWPSNGALTKSVMFLRQSLLSLYECN